MTTAPVISNSSPIIGLERIGQLQLLQALFNAIVVPPAVVREVGSETVLPAWIEQRDLMQAIGPRILSAALGAGESQAISLALEVQPRLLILDDRPARRLAQALHVPVIGTVGVLLLAKRAQLLSAIRPSLDALLLHDFRISQRLYEQVLIDADERT
ncbi:MAG TPA: DUF3368 domain-containing protein [Herpetosiphonaceae bacterium]